MISKDSDYLGNKLKQLKSQAFNRKTGQLDSNPNPSYHAFTSDRFMPSVEDKTRGFTESTRVIPNLQTNYQQQPINTSQYVSSERQIPAFMSQTPPIIIDPKQSMSTQIVGGLRNTEVSFGPPKSSPISQQIIRDQLRTDVLNNDPKVKTVISSNSGFQPEQVTRIPRDPFYTNSTQPVIQTGHVTFAQQDLPYVRSSNGVAFSDQLDSHPDASLSKFPDSKSFMEKHEGKIANELQQKVLSQFEKNNRLGEEIMHLRRQVETETQRINQMEANFGEEFRHSRRIQSETIDTTQMMESDLQTLTENIKGESNKLVGIGNDFDKIRAENEMLRGELKKLGEITSEKILELENNINSVARIRDLEIESFAMEKEKLGNTAEFVIEQMKVHFHESSAKIEEQTGKLQMEKDRLTSELRKVTEEIKAYNASADMKINNVMNQVIQEEQDKHNSEVKEIEAKIRAEEDDIAKVNKRNQDLIGRLQNSEKDGKNRLMAKKAENTRLKEDFNRVEQGLNKLILNLTNETKEYDKKREAIEILKEDHDDLHNRSMAADQRLTEEITSIQESHDEQIKELERDLYNAKEREQRLMQAIEEEGRQLFELQKKHQSTLDDIQRGFNATLNTHFNRSGH